jgi:hypothetical protein
MENSLLIEHLKEFYSEKDTRNFNVLDFVGAYGSPLLALAYAKLFWADFVEFKEMVFLADKLSEEAKEEIEELLENNYKNQEIEKSFNLIEVPSSIFGKNAGDTYDEEDYRLAETLKQIWSCKLEIDFPTKEFQFEVLSPEDTSGEAAIIFFQRTAR